MKGKIKTQWGQDWVLLPFVSSGKGGKRERDRNRGGRGEEKDKRVGRDKKAWRDGQRKEGRQERRNEGRREWEGGKKGRNGTHAT